MSKKCIIAAISENRAIGKNHQLPWSLPNDLQYYKSKIKNEILIVGRKTATAPDTILSEYQNYVVTSRDKIDLQKKASIVHSLEEAIQKTEKEERVFIAGGASIYEQALPLADRMYITIVHTEVKDADTFFPEFKPDEWTKISAVFNPKDKENKFDHTFVIYER